MATIPTSTPAPTGTRLFVRGLRYLGSKALKIAFTIFVGVLITVFLTNQPARRGLGPLESPFEASLERQIQLLVRIQLYGGIWGTQAPSDAEVEALTEELRDEAGLNLPLVPRYLFWTYKALTFDWGRLDVGRGNATTALGVILEFLPNTLLLIGTAYLLVFLIGLPISLYLARNYGNRLDRLFSVLAPLSAVPSWAFAILLISIFAFQLRWLPFGGKFDFQTPSQPVEYILVVAKHMILPVSAIVLSLVFQLVYTWRTFFIIYSEEDYVELARAKGLSPETLQRRYILRPALPYIITSFATTLITFWQLNMAQEAVFQWPGLGWLYIKEALPNFFGESMDPGQLIIIVGIVVIFAYLLGVMVFLLDLVYVMIDPRILLLPVNDTQKNARLKSRGVNWMERLKSRIGRKDPEGRITLERPAQRQAFSWSRAVSNFRSTSLDLFEKSRWLFHELRRYPSAMFGLFVIVILLVGSIYAVVAMPYNQVGKDYGQKVWSGRSYAPRTAAPAWLNIFRKTPLLSTLILDENSQGVEVSRRPLENGWIEKTITFTFDYSYREIPSEIFLYLDSSSSEKVPFASLLWTPPDGRTLDLRGMTAADGTSYDFESNIRSRTLLNQNPDWKTWFVETGQYRTPAFALLFAEPGSSEPVPQHGKYTLIVKGILFEEDSDLQAQLVLLGQVYGNAGTDYLRRDLIVPLFWGMPFALLVGLLGTILTTLVAMVLPAMGVWFGGWVDSFVQMLTEVNMVLPSLSVAVLVSVAFNWNIWIILGIVVVINAFGSPIKTFRSAFLQAKEAPYIETARAYGAGNLRIITLYLVPRVLPVLIPLVVSQVPSFVFWEASLGLFNIKSTYPSWGRIIYEGLANGALYGSPFWVLQPIFLLLVTGLAFSMLGQALERILNPRVITDMPLPPGATKPKTRTSAARSRVPREVVAGLALVLLGSAFVLLLVRATPWIGSLLTSFRPALQTGVPTDNPAPAATGTGQLAAAIPPTDVLVTPTTSRPASTPTLSPTATLSATPALPTNTLTPTLSPTSTQPVTYVLQRGEYPYCIARRFNVDPRELLALNGMQTRERFYAGMTLQIPRSGRPFPGERMQQAHPAIYTVFSSRETLYTIACQFGDLDPQTIAQANQIPVDAALEAGQQLSIP